MVKIAEIIDKLEQFAPLELAASWDNSGWQVFCNDTSVKNIMVSLNPDISVVNQAIEKKCELLISHHPLIFEKINKVTLDNSSTAAIIKAIENGLNIYSVHTNIDKTLGGTSDYLAELLKLRDIETFEEFVKIGNLDSPVTLSELIAIIKEALNSNFLRVINSKNNTSIKRVAVCAGAGADLIGNLNNIDAYITGDVKYHNALDSSEFIIIDAGHFETESIYLPKIKNLLVDLDVEIHIAQETSPWINL